MPKEKAQSAVRCFLGLGSNLGDREENLRRAIGLLRAVAGVEVVAVSAFVETDPVGGPPQGKYLNAAAEVATTLAPRDLLAELLRIEAEMGRVRAERWGPRRIDLDLLLYGNAVIDESDMVLPHPRMHERRFVLDPLSRIAPEAVHPVLRRSVRELLAAL